MNKKKGLIRDPSFGGGREIRTLVLFILAVSDYTFRTIFSKIPKIVGLFFTIVNLTTNGRLNLRFSRFFTRQGLLFLG